MPLFTVRIFNYFNPQLAFIDLLISSTKFTKDHCNKIQNFNSDKYYKLYLPRFLYALERFSNETETVKNLMSPRNEMKK